MENINIYSHNLNCIKYSSRHSNNDLERNIAYTLQKIVQKNPHMSVEKCIEGFAKWTTHKWPSGMFLPIGFRVYLEQKSFQINSGDMFLDWIKAQERVAEEVFV